MYQFEWNDQSTHVDEDTQFDCSARELSICPIIDVWTSVRGHDGSAQRARNWTTRHWEKSNVTTTSTTLLRTARRQHHDTTRLPLSSLARVRYVASTHWHGRQLTKRLVAVCSRRMAIYIDQERGWAAMTSCKKDRNVGARL